MDDKPHAANIFNPYVQRPERLKLLKYLVRHFATPIILALPDAIPTCPPHERAGAAGNGPAHQRAQNALKATGLGFCDKQAFNLSVLGANGDVMMDTLPRLFKTLTQRISFATRFAYKPRTELENLKPNAAPNGHTPDTQNLFFRSFPMLKRDGSWHEDFTWLEVLAAQTSRKLTVVDPQQRAGPDVHQFWKQMEQIAPLAVD